MTSITLRDAGDGEDLLTIDSMTATPTTPAPGKDLQITITGTTSADITDGAYIDVTVKLGLIKLLRKQFDLFAELRASSTTVGQAAVNMTVDQQKDSTIPAGEFTLTYTFALPKEMPRARFDVSAEFWNADDADIATIGCQLDMLSY
ncbi:ML domain-containing protein [Streptomyces sp. SYSU K21746]